MTHNTTKQKKNFWKACLLISIFLVPMLLAGVIYHYRAYIPVKYSNHGKLIQPAIDATWMVKAGQLPAKWHIVYYPKQCCDASCQQTLKQLKHLYQALGKESPRVDVALLLTNDNCQIASTGALNVIHLNPAQINRFDQQLAATRQVEMEEREQRLYIVDPHGNLILFYEQNKPYMAMYNDLKRLLKVSQIG